jgi:predicted AAA+ superfamily ATPase
MIVPPEEVVSVLRQLNPWWSGSRVPDLPPWRRAAFSEVERWLLDPPAHRAVFISGARQVGKTTLLLQSAEALLDSGVAPQNILYVTLDHPWLKLTGIDGVIKLWQEYFPPQPGPEFLLLDEIQFAREWQTWLKLQVDFHKNRRFAVTGSATQLAEKGQESGVGRWHSIRLATLSFYEYIQIRRVPSPALPDVGILRELFQWTPAQFSRAAGAGQVLVPHFYEYLLRGGFPQCAQVASVEQAQKLLREDIVDKVLKRDMTALFGVRRVLELEQTFLYLCLHDGGLLDVVDLCKNLEIRKPTVLNYLALLEATHLIHRLPPFGYGKQILRARWKVYLADPSIAPSVLLRGKSMLENSDLVSRAVESALFKHLVTRYYPANVQFSYWRGRRDLEVDFVTDVDGHLAPFEVKYSSGHTAPSDFEGMVSLCAEKKLPRAYLVTRELNDFGTEPLKGSPETRLLRLPAVLACWWLGSSELKSVKRLQSGV